MIHALHGNLGAAADWEPLGFPDLVAHDLWSDLETEPDLTLEGWGERFSRSIDDPDGILLGYSMGGRLALHAMVAAPEKWAGAVIVSAHPGLADHEDQRRRAFADRLNANSVRTLKWEEFVGLWNNSPIFEGAPPSSAQIGLEPRREAIARAFEYWSLGRQQHLGGHLAACHFPILWVTGERDAKFTALAAELADVLPDFEHAVIPDCGHRVLFENPRELAGTIRDFQKRRL